MGKSRKEIVEYINALKGYEGYVQFSDTKIRECDIFKGFQDIKLEPTEGFVFEAHFFNGKESIAIKQINDSWLISTTDISSVVDEDTQEFVSEIKDFNYKIKMAQVWEAQADGLCDDMEVMKLQKVVFAGFEKGESK